MVKTNHIIVVIFAIVVFVSYYLEGYLLKASLLFNVFYIATILIAAYALSRLETKPLVVFSIITMILGACVEFLNTSDSNWTYYDGGQPPMWVAVGWAFILALAYYGSGFVKKYLKWRVYPLIPVIICFGLFFLFSYTGGYISYITVALYLFMLAMGIYYTHSSNFGWTLAVLILGIVMGTVSELLGAACDLWTYQYDEMLPIHMIFAWAANAFCLLGLVKLAGYDVEELFSAENLVLPNLK